MRWFRFALVPIAALALVGTAAPAFASGGASSPVTVNATVATSVTITGLSSSINFPTGAAGTTQTATGAESYAVSTNDTGGYSLTITPSGTALVDGGSASIANSNVSVKETGAGGTATAKAGQSFSGNSAMTIDTPSGSSGTQNYVEDWSVAIPMGVPAATYSETFTYTATGA